MAGMHDQFGLGVAVGGGAALEPGVAGELAAGGTGQQVAATGRTAVLQAKLALLRDRAGTVGGRRRPQQGQDVGDVVGTEPVDVVDGNRRGQDRLTGAVASGPAAGVAAGSARAAAVVASATCWSSL